MGLMLSIVSRFRKRATTKEVLHGIEEDVKRLETTLERNQNLQKKIVLSLLSFSVLVYCMAIGIFYFFLLPDHWSDRAIWTLPFASFPALVYLLKKAFHFFFVTRIKKIGKALEELNVQKKKILEDVTENETYKVAKELLEKYDPNGSIIQREFGFKSQVVPANGSPQQDGLRQRSNVAKPQDMNGSQMVRPPQGALPALSPGQFRPVGPNMNPRMQIPGGFNGNPRPFMERGVPQQRLNIQKYPIFPSERSFFDKMAEYFVGDGPSYRYALICRSCNGHNGMTLKDEFEYIAFRCCYCGNANPARKNRPNAPTLEEESRLSDRESDRERNSTDNEIKDGMKSEDSDVNDSKDEPDESQTSDQDQAEHDDSHAQENEKEDP